MGAWWQRKHACCNMSLRSRNCSKEFEESEVEGKECRERWFCKDKISARDSRNSLLATMHESLLWNRFISRWSRDSFIVLPEVANNKSIAFARSQRWYTLGANSNNDRNAYLSSPRLVSSNSLFQTTRCVINHANAFTWPVGPGWFVRFSRGISAHQGPATNWRKPLRFHNCLWFWPPLPLLKSVQEASFDRSSRHQAPSGLVASHDVESTNPVSEFTRAASTDRRSPVLEIRLIMWGFLVVFLVRLRMVYAKVFVRAHRCVPRPNSAGCASTSTARRALERKGKLRASVLDELWSIEISFESSRAATNWSIGLA